MPNLPPPQTVTDFYAAALLDRLDDLHQLLSDRLPALPGEPVATAEPALPDPQPDVIAVAEPAPRRRGRPPKNQSERRA